MLLLNPERVSFEGETIDGVRSVAIERQSSRTIEERSGSGPFASFVDVPERSVVVRVVAEGREGVRDGPGLGALGELEVSVSALAGVASIERVRIRGVVVRSGHELGRRDGARRVLELRGVSADGGSDPVRVAPATVPPGV
ncbi:MAG: hypothetical protein AAGG07_08735 [Planctomycetota bacterium]